MELVWGDVEYGVLKYGQIDCLGNFSTAWLVKFTVSAI